MNGLRQKYIIRGRLTSPFILLSSPQSKISMKNLLLPALLLLGFPTLAQITITSTDMPSTGDTIRVSVNNSIGSIDPENTDTNFVWDYTSLIPDSQRVEKYVSC